MKKIILLETILNEKIEKNNKYSDFEINKFLMKLL
jgi:hypothetical protein